MSRGSTPRTKLDIQTRILSSLLPSIWLVKWKNALNIFDSSLERLEVSGQVRITRIYAPCALPADVATEFIAPDVSKLGECEFSLISEMNSQLIVHHPYRTLSELQPELSLTSDEVALAWSVINDHYLTDLPLLYPPHVIAVMAIIVAVVFKPSQTSFHGSAAPLASAMRDGGMNILAALGEKGGNGPPPRIQRLIGWLAESEVDIKAVIECTQELVSLYEVWEQYSEKHCKELLGRMVKSKNLDK